MRGTAGDMSLDFARDDIMQTGSAERGAIVVLPFGKGKKQQKIALGKARCGVARFDIYSLTPRVESARV